MDVDWWADEELPLKDLMIAKHEILEIKPKIIISHDGPREIVKDMFIYHKFLNNRTSDIMQDIFEAYQPTKWIFGHHHRSVQKIIKNTLFICLTELEMIKIN